MKFKRHMTDEDVFTYILMEFDNLNSFTYVKETKEAIQQNSFLKEYKKTYHFGIISGK